LLIALTNSRYDPSSLRKYYHWIADNRTLPSVSIRWTPLKFHKGWMLSQAAFHDCQWIKILGFLHIDKAYILKTNTQLYKH